MADDAVTAGAGPTRRALLRRVTVHPRPPPWASCDVAPAYDDVMSSATVKVTTNGQMSLPAELRHRWGSRSVVVVDRGDYAIVRPVPDDVPGALAGAYSGPGPSTDDLRALERAQDAGRDEARSADG